MIPLLLNVKIQNCYEKWKSCKDCPSDKEEKEAWEKLNRIDCFLNKIRESIRNGSKIYLKEMGGIE